MADNKITLTKKDLNKAYWRFQFFAQACCSYERLQAPGFFSGMRNIIEKLYADDEQGKIEACKRHMEFYNSEFALVGPVILGAVIAMEEEKANGAEIEGEAISAVKTSLMGPLAGVGDTLRQGTLIPIIGSIAISLGQAGNLIAPIFYMAVTLALNWGISYTLYNKVYQKGSSYIAEFFSGNRMEKIMTLITSMGAVTIGALAASTVKLSTPLKLILGQKTLAVQTDILDAIILNLLPFCAVMLVYWLIAIKKVSINKVIVGIFVVCIVGGLLGII
ncbi:PTS system mannose/fructose/sorbose family transporter subunit IID [Absicoccus intestinalis]|uniref:PTS system mannose/fructose/sorbose family transporter subunit IID n=1 Tax=Absicoccus intestinalis TaxID=2926319 RepID=A0ABU4WM71_9FIRM|nr:PTS system mannose/fructose/sorbose family transporter subunit IID [Absicoccus sp. CLA-KB-P134]MDX8417324.1 PTS system mannose/fructose/sorbose family transporter subunit IID [Absicoccus sp. CLA-KB-P134]